MEDPIGFICVARSAADRRRVSPESPSPARAPTRLTILASDDILGWSGFQQLRGGNVRPRCVYWGSGSGKSDRPGFRAFTGSNRAARNDDVDQGGAALRDGGPGHVPGCGRGWTDARPGPAPLPVDGRAAPLP